MSEINQSQGPSFQGNQISGASDAKLEEIPQGIAFQGNKTENLNLDPKAAVNRSFINQMYKVKIGEHEVAFGSKEIKQVQDDLKLLSVHPAAVQKASALFPSFQGHAESKGYKHPDAFALALQNYAATKEFVHNALNN